MLKYGSLLLFIVLTSVAGIVIGMNTPPGEWYAELSKPFFTPPNWLFAPVWTVLYVVIGIVGWRAWGDSKHRLGFFIWCLQLLLNFSWSPFFFIKHDIGIALLILIATTLLIALFIAERWNKDRIAAWLFVPYLLWSSFAAVLNTAVYWLNR